MANFKQQMFQQYAGEGLKELIEEYKRKFGPKKEDRFSHKGITYEIGPAKIEDGKIEYEISSKIPQDELPQRTGIVRYFEEVKKIVSKAKKKPFSIDMENIIRELGANEIKERDYVKLRYRYKENELYNEKAIIKEAQELRERAQDLPDVPSVSTPTAKLILLRLKETIKEKTEENVRLLMDANETVRKKFKGEK